MQDRTFKVRGTVDEPTISKLLDWLRRCSVENTVTPVVIKIDMTTDPGGNKVVFDLFERLQIMPHPPIHTIAGIDTWYAGALLFLIGEVRTLGDACTMRFEWNRVTAEFIAKRTGKTTQQLWASMVRNPALNPERVCELGVATVQPKKPHTLRLAN